MCVWCLIRWSYLFSVQSKDKPDIVTTRTQMDTLFDLLADSIPFVGFTRLTKLASSTLALPTAPASRSGLYVMERRVCQVVLGRTVVVKEAPGFRALIRRSTSHTCGPHIAIGRHARPSRHTKPQSSLLEAIFLPPYRSPGMVATTRALLDHSLNLVPGPDPDPVSLSDQLMFPFFWLPCTHKPLSSPALLRTELIFTLCHRV